MDSVTINNILKSQAVRRAAGSHLIGEWAGRSEEGSGQAGIGDQGWGWRWGWAASIRMAVWFGFWGATNGRARRPWVLDRRHRGRRAPSLRPRLPSTGYGVRFTIRNRFACPESTTDPPGLTPDPKPHSRLLAAPIPGSAQARPRLCLARRPCRVPARSRAPTLTRRRARARPRPLPWIKSGAAGSHG
jgi:hypothetical protein